MIQLSTFQKPLSRIFLGSLGFGTFIVCSLLFNLFINLTVLSYYMEKLYASSFVIAGACGCTMICAVFADRYQKPLLGWIGLLLALSSTSLLLYLIWLMWNYSYPVNNDFYMRLTGGSINVTLAYTHALLLALPIRTLRHKWLPKVSAVLIASLTILIQGRVWLDWFFPGYDRLVEANAILVAAATLATPIMVCLDSHRSGSETAGGKLVLTHVSGSSYRDSSGVEYEVRQVNAEQAASEGMNGTSSPTPVE
ncbi:MAG: hypothetical protein D6820_08515 [Lentisphaerae bacterium]|nr:MAG: hypothetical protein D6820_08515 [Lentisphaerota bacterium]